MIPPPSTADAPGESPGPRVPGWQAVVGFAVLYVVAVRVGVALVNPQTHMVPVWPAAGLAVAGLLGWGIRPLWPVLLASVVVAGILFNPAVGLAKVGIMAGDFLGPLAGAWLTERLARGRNFPKCARDVMVFILAGAGSMGAVCATCGALSMALSGIWSREQVPRLWLAWFTSDFIAVVVLVPALLAWAVPRPPAGRHDDDGGSGTPMVNHRAPRVEAAALGLTSVLSTQAIFGGWPFPAHRLPLEFLCGPALLWAAFRFPRRGVAAALLAFGVLALVNTLRDPSANAAFTDARASLIYLQFFVGSVAGMALATAAAVREREAQAAVLEETVSRRTGEIRAELADRVRAEAVAEESRAMLRRIIDLFPQAVWWKDQAGVYLGCNRLVVESVGLSAPADLLGKTDAELPWPPGVAQGFRAVDDRVLTTGRAELRYVHRQQFPDGRMLILTTSKVPLHDASGQVVGVLGTSEDITDREHIEAELRAARSDLEARVSERTAALARANERLHAGEERFRRAVLDAPIPIMLHAEDGEVLGINRAWTALSGYRHEHIPTVGHWIERAYRPEHRGPARETVRKIYDITEAFEEGEFTIRTADGNERVWDFSSAPLGRLPDGRRTVISSAKDVTARRQVEDALREGEARLRLALEAGRMSVWQFDVAGGGLVWSASARPDGRGWTADTFPMTLEQFTAAVLPEDRALVRAAAARCVADGTHTNAQYRFLRQRDGQVRWLESRAQPRFDAAGRVVAVTGLTQDITERRRAEEALRESERRLRLALTAGAMGFWRIDLTEGRAEWDEQVQRLNGWEPGTFPGDFASFVSRVHPEDRPTVQALARTISDQKREFTVQFRVVWPDGSEHWLEDRGTPDLDATGRVVALTGITMDITERRLAEIALHTAKAEAERANAAKSEFLSRMSHELRTPLNAILGFGQLLELADLEPKHVQSVGHILRAGRHLLALIDEVLDIARIESGKLALFPEPVHAGELMAEVVNLLRPLAARHDVRVRPGGAGGGPRFGEEPFPDAAPSTHVLADPQRLKQVLLNLLSNAIKYNHPGGEVFAACRPAPGHRLRLEVRDTGRGLTPADVARLFTPFERFGVERDSIEGTGIGLVIARRLAESMGGRILVESVPGVGSTFGVELPCVAPPSGPGNDAEGDPTVPGDFRDAAHASLPAEELPLPGSSTRPSRTVLYIEDNLSNLQLIERVFDRGARGGERVFLLSAMQGGLGLDLARQHRPDLILLDLQLPDLHGEEVLARLRADPATRAIPVIILSADATVRQRENLLEAGAVAYLTKPLDVMRFLELVRRTLAENYAA